MLADSTVEMLLAKLLLENSNTSPLAIASLINASISSSVIVTPSTSCAIIANGNLFTSLNV